MFLDKGDFMEKIYKNKPVVDKNGRYSMEQIELDSIKTVITELTEPQLKDLLAIIQFQQRVNKLFFDEEDKFEQYEDESNKAWKEYKKIKEAKEVLAQEPEMRRDWDEKVGDRMIKLVVIGQHLDREQIEKDLDSCLD